MIRAPNWIQIQLGGLRTNISRSTAALSIGVSYLITGIASYLYSGGGPFWLLFVIQGLVVIGSTLVLRDQIEEAPQDCDASIEVVELRGIEPLTLRLPA